MSIDHQRLVTAGKRLARVAGALYLLIVVLGGIAHLAVHAGVRVPGYAANTAQSIPPGPTPVSLAVDLATATILAFVGVTVYLLLRRIDRRSAGALVVFVAVAAGMILINLLFHHAALLVATGSGSTAVGSNRSGGLVVLLLDLHDRGYTITGAFFGMWLLALGYLAYQSSRFPRVLSTLLIVSLIVSWLVGLGCRDCRQSSTPSSPHPLWQICGWSPIWSPGAGPCRGLPGSPPWR